MDDLPNSRYGITFTKNVVRSASGRVLKESGNWHIGFATWKDYQEWKSQQKNIRIIQEERYY